MKNILIVLELIVLIFFPNLCFSAENILEPQTTASGVICSRNQKRCVVGEHVVRTNGRKPLYIRDGVVCTPNRRTCTNGFSWMHSNKPLF